jgi:hypothetical protein
MKRSWAGEVRNVSLLVASPRKTIRLVSGLKGVQLVISDACRGLVESVADFLPGARYQRCMVHFYRNVFSYVPSTRVREVSHMLKAIHAQESREAADKKARAIVDDLRASKMAKAADLVEQAVHETLTYSDHQARGEPMATGNIADRHARLQGLAHHRQLLICRDAPSPGNAGNHFDFRESLGHRYIPRSGLTPVSGQNGGHFMTPKLGLRSHASQNTPRQTRPALHDTGEAGSRQRDPQTRQVYQTCCRCYGLSPSLIFR